MKQSEKLDIILRYLYERKDDNREYSIADILASSGIDTNATEVTRLAEHLEKDKYITLNNLSAKLKKAKITYKGITYAEGDSYSHRGNNIVNHYNIVNSPQANIVVNSNQVTITQSQHDKATEIIKQIRETITKDESVEVAMRTEILECLTEIESGLENKKAPKFAIKSLLGMGSDGARMYMSDIGRWGAIDPLSEKYMKISPYAYVANNPIKAYDPDGKRIYYVNDEGELKRATRKMLKTLTGGETFKKYLRSKTEDVYIASTKLDSEASGRTVKNAHEKNQYGISVNKNLKGVSMDSKVDSEIKGAFSIYKNVDFKQSEGKKIHLIAMDKETLKSSTPYEGAEAIFHEMNAHIQNSTGDAGEDHKRYGKAGFGLYTRRGPIRDPLGNLVTDAKGQPLYENVPPNSPAGKIVRELKALQKDEEGN